MDIRKRRHKRFRSYSSSSDDIEHGVHSCPPSVNAENDSSSGKTKFALSEEVSDDSDLESGDTQIQLRFNVLPTEILERIFKMLPAMSLMAVSQLGDARLDSISCGIKSANFSGGGQKLTTGEIHSFFTCTRVEHITEVNFNFVYTVSVACLLGALKTCPFLTKLSVIECGFSFAEIQTVIKRCTQLQELNWSVCCTRRSGPRPFVALNLKKICLLLKPSDSYKQILYELSQTCPAASFIFNTSDVFATSLPPNDAPIANVISFRLFGRNEAFCLNAGEVGERTKFLNMVNASEESTDLICSDLICSPFLQFSTYTSHLEALPDYSTESVSSLNLNVISYAVFRDHLPKITKITGKRLKSAVLSVSHVNYPDEPEIITEMLLTVLVSSAHYLTVLDLKRLHFSYCFSFKSISCLKNLINLTLAACSFKSIDGFKLMVSECTNVQYFSVICCSHCKDGPTDDKLYAIQYWRSLRSLYLLGLAHCRVMSFLIPVSRSCADLTALQVVRIGDENVCHYIPNVIHILRRCEKLKFLRIEQRYFVLNNYLFWKSLQGCKNLEGLCLIARNRIDVPFGTVKETIIQLKKLHVFHMCTLLQTWPGHSSQGVAWTGKIKKLIKENGIEVYDVKCNISQIYQSGDSGSCCSAFCTAVHPILL